METEYFQHKVIFKGRRYKFQGLEINCCNNVWQMLLSVYYPEREKAILICPTCKKSFTINGSVEELNDLF